LLDGLDYRCIYTLLNAANYGVPQTRERFFLVAIHKKARLDPRFPAPTTKVVLPPGYAGTRRFALKNILNGDLLRPGDQWYRPSPKAREDTPPCVTAEDALADLPRLDDHIRKVDRRGARRLDGNREYGTTPHSRYASLMRNWPGFVSDGRLRDHVTRCLTDRDYRIFEAMMPGEDYPKAHARGLEFFGQRLEELQREGRILEENSEEYEEEKAKYVPPYDPEKFPNKWRKMSAREPARTLMAHLGKDTYSHIHYDSTQKRVISVREAARLQSFPDGFRFSGTMNPAFRQIGNSVPPLLAWAIASELLDVLGAKSRKPVPVAAGGSSSAEQTSIKVA
jgi:DNA (cytosine-5)-methyltransferase 1